VLSDILIMAAVFCVKRNHIEKILLAKIRHSFHSSVQIAHIKIGCGLFENSTFTGRLVTIIMISDLGMYKRLLRNTENSSLRKNSDKITFYTVAGCYCLTIIRRRFIPKIQIPNLSYTLFRSKDKVIPVKRRGGKTENS